MGLDSGLIWSVIYDFCFGYCIEGSGGHHEAADAFIKIAYLNPYVPEEGISIPSPNDHDFFRVYACYEEFHGKPDWSDCVPTYL